MNIWFRCILIFNVFSCFAQHIEHLSPVINPMFSEYVALQYDNDLFAKKDQYYTQGISFVVVNDAFKRNPINCVLIDHSNFENVKYGINLNHSVYTPSSILSDSFLLNDRPYSANLTVGFFKSGILLAMKRQIASELTIGLIGQSAFGKEMQTGIHRWTNNDTPKGWQNQLKNAPIINYTIQIDQQLFGYQSLFALIGKSKLNLGSYETNLNMGLEVHFGQFNQPYHNVKHRFEYFIYSKSTLKLVGYDAGLIGGIRLKNEAYSIAYAQVRPVVAEQHLGFIIRFPHVFFGFNFVLISKEFEKGTTHSWGGIRLGFF